MSSLKTGRNKQITKWLKDNGYDFEEVDLFDDEDRGYYKVYGDCYSKLFWFTMKLNEAFPQWHFDYCNKCSGNGYYNNYWMVGRVKNWSQLDDSTKYHIIDNGG